MAIYPALKYVDFDGLTDTQRDELKKTLQEHKRALQAAMRDVDRGLRTLAKKPKPKRTAKRKIARGPTKR